ncbi:PREDICTED: uncharacterized protein C3orf17 homolog isoform X2 [Calidris pugnax]|uniref:uncharacterized protein C3orf17 homolog isoform X2 n=1 Tax=Calidris pugnax TaxID=198806 RepID=UPI00071C89E0|nr:PREDICTED: uncharacterized protein C3orf17 homolog isoform X2 [Calidris pugnax]
MAAPEAAWNRLEVPWPAGSATVALAAGHPAVRWLPALRRRCGLAVKRLSGTGLSAEERVLRAVLYVYHNRLLRHRPYLAMQQVEQCLKRLWKTNLVGCIETLAGLIPKIQYGCVLQSLISLYGILSTSLHLVSETQQMPYIKGFAFPSDISNFLGVNVSSEVKKQKARMLTTKKPTSWLKQLFPAMPEAASVVEKKRHFATCRSAVKNCSVPCPADIGEPVLVTRASRGKHLGFDVKSLLRPSRPPAQQGISISSTPIKAKSASLSSRLAKSQHAGALVQMVQAATSFGELSEALRKAILWCKGNRFKSAAYFLRNKLLKSNRLHHVEAQGCSLKKKLCCVKTSVRKYLLYGSQNVRWPKQCLGARFCRRRIKSSTRLKRTLRQNPAELFGICESRASLVLSAYQDGPPRQEGHSSADTASVKLSTAGTPKQLLREGSPGPVWKEATENVDIDSIFAAMGV